MKAHSQYADLEKKMAELKKEHIQEISQITKDLELHKGLLGDVEGVKFALEKELRNWQAEALQGRDELQAKTSQVKAYKKQVDQLKEKSETQEQQVTVNYEMYVGVPILAKWLTVQNAASTSVTVDRTVIEYIGTQKPYVPLSLSPQAQPWEHDTSALTESWLYVEANVPHGGLVQWGMDAAGSSVSPGADEPVLNCTYTFGPGVEIATTSKSSKINSALLSQFDTYKVLKQS